jgi:hypothetical protein
MYHAVVLAEEDYLRRKFRGAFDEYCERTPRWIPTLRGIYSTFSQSTFAWTRVLHKEYSAPLGWTLPIVLIASYNMGRTANHDAHQLWILIGILALAVVFWLGAGWLKKGRSLPQSLHS